MEDEGKQKAEQEESDQRSAPSGKVVYGAILKEGEEELLRPSSALFWSGLAAGLSMGFSMIAEGLLMAYLPDAHWRPLVAKFGYSVGFLIVILGRQQLFTENTLTPMLPLLKRKDGETAKNVLRLWAVVLVANLLGALLVAIVCARTNAFDPHVREAFIEMGHKATEHGFWTVLLRAVFAGWLIALMVWLLPFAESARVWVIIIITYVVGLGHFSHIIAGAVETFALAAAGQASWMTVLGRYIVPTLAGNILGGVMLVATLNHAQIVAGGKGQDV
ncbi:MAG: formate-nitrite transporter family protein [Acidobacteriota bacterium]|nr:formate-nitrite transporter family protein [Acidobacteriota bacterium]